MRIDRILNTFQIDKVKEHTALQQWLALPIDTHFSPLEEGILNIAIEKYNRIGDGWNEEELKMHFISLVFAVADLNIDKVCKTYFERTLKGQIDGRHLTVVCDSMVAKPDRAGLPTQPYFFLQELKQAQRFGKTDPEGQMLAAMLLAQNLTQTTPACLYGSFVVERHWYFATLIGHQYSLSQSYNATIKTELHKIVGILLRLKQLIVAI